MDPIFIGKGVVILGLMLAGLSIPLYHNPIIRKHRAFWKFALIVCWAGGLLNIVLGLLFALAVL